LDESTDVSDTAQLLIFIQRIDTDYNITEELASLESISGTTKGADIFEKVNYCIENFGLTWEKLCSITIDGAPNMVGRNTGLVGRIAELTTSKMIETLIFLHCIIHQQGSELYALKNNEICAYVCTKKTQICSIICIYYFIIRYISKFNCKKKLFLNHKNFFIFFF